MPYKLKGNCVVKADTEKTVKCHKTKKQALAHMAALEINVDEERWQDMFAERPDILEAITRRAEKEQEVSDLAIIRMMFRN